MIKHLQLAALISLVVTLCIFLYGAITGYMNNYRMIIEVENRVAIIEAYRGRVTALHIQYDENGEIVSNWRISSRQLIYGHQWIRIFEQRENMYGDLSDNNVTRENLLTQHMWFRFTRIDRIGNTVYLWDNYPVPTLHKGQIEGLFEVEQR